MRSSFVLVALPLLSLAACGGAGTGGPTVGSAPPVGFGAAVPPATDPTPAPAPSPTGAAPTNLFDVAATTEFAALGGLQSFSVNEKGSQLYMGNAGTVAAPSGSITYNPRDGIFVVKLEDASAGVTKESRFQDPAHRSTVDSARSGELQVPLLSGFNYLQSLDGTAAFTFFYQRPGQSGAFVSLAGFERSDVDKATGKSSFQQGAMVFGTKTVDMQVPVKGTGRYDGQFLATMSGGAGPSAAVLQWINGTSAVEVDFGARTVGLSLNGIVGPAFVKDIVVGNNMLAIDTGAIFTATGSAGWAQSGSNGFAGRFTSAGFKTATTTTSIDFTSVSAGSSVAGASSIDGAFYGPDAKNIGGSFRIVGGVPNQRVDILGAFAGAKK